MFKTDTNTPLSEIDARIAKLQTTLQQKKIDAALILQPSDLFYYAGTIQQSHLYVPANGQPLLLARKSFERACAESPLANILPLGSPKKIPAILKEQGLPWPDRLGLELDVLPANLFFMYSSIFDKAQIKDVSLDIRIQRAVKSEYEIDLIKQAGALADKVAVHMKTILKQGLTEIALAGQVEAYSRSLGHQGIVRMRLWGNELFYGHLMSGASATVPSYLASPTGGTSTSAAVAQGAGLNTIRAHEPVLLDYVFAFNGYLADHTRIFSIGELDDDLMSGHEAMLKIQDKIATAAKPGVKTGDIYDLALNLASESGFGDNFMGAGSQRIRFVGHGIGLELDEFPFLAQGQKMPLQEGMVIALEPKLIFPNRGVVGIENSHAVTSGGLKRLTNYSDSITVV
ncbi:MAG: aminopeptidase P family protein [Desulfobacteraceae bacterium]|nr:aminopeptidase P family protein [Desulfobacteraceae bacterium]